MALRNLTAQQYPVCGAAASGSICFEFPWETPTEQQNSLMHVLGKTMKLLYQQIPINVKPNQTTVLIRLHTWHTMSTRHWGQLERLWNRIQVQTAKPWQKQSELTQQPQCCSLSAKLPVFLQPRPYLDTAGREHRDVVRCNCQLALFLTSALCTNCLVLETSLTRPTGRLVLQE